MRDNKECDISTSSPSKQRRELMGVVGRYDGIDQASFVGHCLLLYTSVRNCPAHP